MATWKYIKLLRKMYPGNKGSNRNYHKLVHLVKKYYDFDAEASVEEEKTEKGAALL